MVSRQPRGAPPLDRKLDELFQHETTFKLLADTLPRGVFVHDGSLIRYVNSYLADILGRPRDELFDISVERFTKLLVAEEYQKILRMKMTRPSADDIDPVQMQLGVVSPKGQERWVEVLCHRIPVAEGTIGLGFVRDFTHHRQVHEQLRESEEKYRRLFDTETDAIVLVDAETKMVTDANKAALRLYGYSKDEILKLKAVQLSDEPEKSAASIERSIASKFENRALRRHRKKSGATFQAEICSNLFSWRGRKSIVAVIRDISEQQRANEALRESEQKYVTLFNGSSDAVFIHDFEGNILDFNQRALEISGYSSSELKALSISHLHPPEALERSAKCFEEIAATGRVSFEIDFKKKSGEIIMAQVDSSVLTIGGQKVIQGIVRDITERRRAEDALRQSEERFRTAFLTSPDPVCISRLEDGLFTDVNDGFTLATGYSRDEVIGKTSAELEMWEELPDRNRMVEKLKQDGFVTNVEVRMRVKDGTIRTGLLSARILMLDNAPHVLAITRDIEELKNVERELRQEKDKAQKYLDVAGTMIVALDSEGKVALINKRGCEILGRPENAILGEDWFDQFIPEDERNSVKSVFHQVIASGTPSIDYYENRVLRSDGAELLIAWYNTILRDERGDISGTLSSGVDITERDRMERELHDTYERLRTEHIALENKNIALNEVLANIEEEKDALKRGILENIQSSITPTVSQLRATATPAQLELLEALETEMAQITSGFASALKEEFPGLTPRQVQICRLIRNGYTSKEIAHSLHISLATVHKHRETIREKLGIKSAGINLNAYLHGLQIRTEST